MEYHLPLLAMSEEQLKAFLNALEADTGLQAKIEAAVEGEIDTPDETAAVLAIAKEAGFGITAADLVRFEAQNIMELSDEELEGVAGGKGVWDKCWMPWDKKANGKSSWS
jgi:predicted ribosomally synthesized peptide with nif11-like leader